MSGLTASAAAAASLTGAGSSLVAPIEADWGTAFQTSTGVSVNYQAVGSGTGISDISKGLVDFGASDAPLTSAQAAGCAGCVQIPWALSATGVGFHINRLKKLHLTGPVLAQIYLGQITKWNDRRITSLNKGTRLPNLAITPVYRSDRSGDTYAFTNYLSAVSSTWSMKIGFATSVGFTHGVGGKGNSGVTAVLESTNGSIAYIAVSYLIAHGLPATAIKNAAGNYEYPNLSNIESAAQTVKRVPAGNAISIVNPPRRARTGYPISTFTYVIAPKHAPQVSILKQFILYALSPSGQAFGPSLDFAPLPRVVLNASKQSVNSL